MGHWGGYAPATYAAAIGLMQVAAAPAWAQDTSTAGFSFGLNLSEQILHDDGDTNLRTDLGLTLDRKTAGQSFRFSTSAGLEKTFSGGIDTDLQDPRVSLGYSAESRAARMAVDLGYRRSELDTLAQEDALGDNPLVLGAGQREDTNLGLSLEFGRSAPFGTTLSYGYRESDYFGTVSTTLFDSVSTDAAIGFRFDLTQTMSARLTFSHRDVDREGSIDVLTETVTAALDVEISPTVSATVEIGDSSVRRSGSVPRSVPDDTIYGIDLVAARPNGSWRGSLDSTLSENGRRTSLTVDRQIDLARGSFSAGIGVSRNDDTDSSDPTYNLNYVQDLPRGQVRAAFDQAFTTDSAGNETMDSRLSLNLQQELTAVSSLGAGITFRDFDRLQTGGIDSNQLDLTVDYSHNLTDDWAVFAGFTHSRREQDGSARTTEDTVFLGVRTSLKWRR